MALWGALVMLGQQAAKNPSLSLGGQGEHDFMNKYDPIGTWVTGWGGDPLNIYGNKDNPEALLFPSSHLPGIDGPAGPYSGMNTGMQPNQDMKMMQAYQSFLKNAGAPPMPQIQPPPPPIRPGAGGRFSNDSPGIGGGGYRGPMPGSGGTGMMNFGNLSALSRFNGAQPMPYFST